MMGSLDLRTLGVAGYLDFLSLHRHLLSGIW